MIASYGELSAEFYDLDKPVAPELALAWYAAELEGCDRILEPMCGSGRFMLPLLQRGLSVAGFDPSPHMLARCRARLEAAGLQAHVWQSTVLEAASQAERYAGVFIPASSFCLLDDAPANLDALRGLLDAGGRLLIEFELPHPSVNWPGETTRTVTAGKRQIRLHSRVTYDARTQVETHTNRYELKLSGRVVQTEDETLSLRCRAPDEMRNLLTQAGFKDIDVVHPEFGWVARAAA